MINESLKKSEDVCNRTCIDVKEKVKLSLQEWTGQLETRTADILRQVSVEHAERVRAQEFYAGQLETKARILEEKVNYQAEETRRTCLAMEGQTTEDLRKKNDCWESSLLEVKKSYIGMQKWLENTFTELNKRSVGLEEQFGNKIGEFEGKLGHLRNELEKECENIGGIIKDEVGARFSSDVYFKK